MKLLWSAVLSAAVCCVSPFAFAQEATEAAPEAAVAAEATVTAEATVVVAADCICAPAKCCETSCCRTKKFQKVEYQKEVCRIRRVTVIDECGCESKKCMKVSECVTRTKLERVDPCAPTCLDKIKNKLNCCCANLKAKCNSRKCCPDPYDCNCSGEIPATSTEPTAIEVEEVIEQPQPDTGT